MKNSKSLILKLITALALSFSFVTAINIETNNNNSCTQTVQAARKKSKAERAAKRWIAMRESGGNYYARNGVCYGKYQLNIAYLNGNYSKKNQERTADTYVYGRYGSWVNAKNFWLAHHWY
ncbi:putative aggregation promoting protein [Lactobacillus sp. wkB10]|nr:MULTISPECIES: aggregation promoting factor surface protein [unclassified Lactobacillus]KGG53582.1 putative aggregation promoting protein [Lactobacillus sp. wkB10]